jgi:hypothetical protein
MTLKETLLLLEDLTEMQRVGELPYGDYYHRQAIQLYNKEHKKNRLFYVEISVREDTGKEFRKIVRAW